MGATKRKRQFLILGIILAALLFLIALPLWFPWILKPILKNYGVSYASYERTGYSRFTLRDVKFSNASATFEAKEIKGGASRLFAISNWSLDLVKSKKAETNSVYLTSKKIDTVLAQLNRWIRGATFTNGAIRSGKLEILVAAFDCKNGVISSAIFSKKHFPPTEIIVQFHPNRTKQISIKTAAWNWETQLNLRDEGQSLKIEGDTFWQSNRCKITAQFGTNGSLPETASLAATSFRIPARLLKLEGYGDLSGSLQGGWQSNRFEINLAAHAQPSDRQQIYLSPIEAVIRAVGDTNSVRIETANISSPWLQAKLSKNVEFNFRGEMLSPEATLAVAANLAKQKWFDATGELKGEAVLRRTKNRFPEAKFNLAGAQIELSEIQAERFDLQGELDWPWLKIDSTKIQFKDGATAEGNFSFNAVAREISEGKLKLGGSIGHKFLPPEISYKNIALDATFYGPLKKLSHEARVRLEGLKLPRLAPLGIEADWRGCEFNLEKFQANVSAKNSSLVLAGSVNAQTNRFDAQFQKIDFQKNQKPIFTLQKPFAVAVTKLHEGKMWAVEIEPARWRGTTNELLVQGNLEWPERGNVSAAAQQFDLSNWSEFFDPPLPELFFEKVSGSASWTNGAATFALSAITRFLSADGTPFSADLETRGNAEGISIARAEVGSASEIVLSGKGFLPITFAPANRTRFVQILPKQRIDFQAATLPNPKFWERIAQWTRVDLREPSISLGVSGTMDSPVGRIVASAREIVLKPKKRDQTWPRFQNLIADFDLVRDRIALNRFEIFVEGQPVSATGEIPLPKDFQTHWRKAFDWRKADAHLKIVDAQLAPFSRLFPGILSPLGTINLDALVARGGKMSGEFRVAGAALRPISSLGSVRDIDARFKLSGERMKVETFRGFIGGQPVDLVGEVNLANFERATGLPIFNFNLRGTNVPLTRRPELILRSDLDLKIANTNGGEPLISGTLNLRDSFYLSDLKLLVPGKVAKPKQRPPFFSVETEPFAGWRLNVAVKGNDFLRVRSPLFRGEISANFKVEGTLQEPFALGDAKINSGVVQFPFANLRVTQGFVSLTSANPFRPQLAISAASRTFGYDVKMDINGFADKPLIEFSSNPGLRSEQILLMVTAGELPRDEINFSAQQKAGRVAFFLGKNLVSKFGGNKGTEEKLEIRSGEDVSDHGQQTYYLEYKLSHDWSIIGEYDRFGGVNAGFKWKFFEK